MRPLRRGSRLMAVTVATVMWSQVPPRQPDPVSAALLKVHTAQSEGRRADTPRLLAEAIELIGAADIKNPNYPNQVQQVALQLEARGFDLRAQEIYEKALNRAAALGEGHPSYLGVLSARANSYVGRQHEVKATQAFERLLALAEKSPDGDRYRWLACQGLSQMYERTGRAAEAEALLLKQRSIAQSSQKADTKATADPASVPAMANRSAAFGQILSSRAFSPVMSPMMFGGRPVDNAEGALVQFLLRQGRRDEAEKLLRQQIAESSKASNASQGGWMQSEQMLTGLLVQQQRWEEAVALQQQMYDRALRSGNEHDRSAAPQLLQSLAQTMEQAGKLDQADAAYRKAIESAPPPPAGQPDFQRTSAINNYGQSLLRQKRFEDVAKLLGESGNGEQTEMLQAQLLEHKGDRAGAQKIRDGMQARQMRSYAPRNQVTVGPLLQKASEAVQAGRSKEAVDLVNEAIGLSDRAVDGPMLASEGVNIARQLAQKGEVTAADELCQRIRTAVSRQSEYDAAATGMFFQSYSYYLIDRKRWDEAASALEAWRQNIIDNSGSDSARLDALFFLKTSLLQQKRAQSEVLPVAQSNYAHLTRVHGEISEPAVRGLQAIAEAYASRQDLNESLRWRAQALTVGEKLFPPSDIQRTNLLSSLAMAEHQAGHREEAIRHMQQAVALAKGGHRGQSEFLESQLDMFLQQQAYPNTRPAAGRWFGPAGAAAPSIRPTEVKPSPKTPTAPN